MEEQFNQVHDYFKDRFLKTDFKITNINENEGWLSIDVTICKKKFKISTNLKHYCHIYGDMTIKLTEEESEIFHKELYNHIKTIQAHNRLKLEIAEAEYKKLKDENERLHSITL